MLYGAVEQIKATYGKQIISEAYEAFKNALSEPAFCEETGIDIALEKTEAAKLFNDVFNRMVDMESSFPDEADGYVLGSLSESDYLFSKAKREKQMQ